MVYNHSWSENSPELFKAVQNQGSRGAPIVVKKSRRRLQNCGGWLFDLLIEEGERSNPLHLRHHQQAQNVDPHRRENSPIRSALYRARR